ncbi:MAG TPA: redoxin family protein [Candidatus Baltobacteraceae bacterium]|nr:redoxin family protein [Candidatus Baltobacteraceae bacterium]
MAVAAFALLLALSPGQPILPFDGNAGWLNSPPLAPAELHGKVTLVDFWEYTCVNCLRTLPYLREWYKRYKQYGFTIVGVHSPEFAFSGERANVTAALPRLGVTWPVVLDDSFAIWKRYGVNAWPTEFLFDQSGKLVESTSGEGNYQQTESKIQALLVAQDPHVKLPHVMALLPQDSYDKPGAVCYPKTDEVVIAHQGIANAPRFADPTRDFAYTDPGAHADGNVYLGGYWHRNDSGAVSGGSNGYAALRYHAIEVVAVMRPEPGKTVRVVVTQDGAPIAKTDAGSDVRYDERGNSYVTVDEPRAYALIENAKFGQHELRISPDGYGLGIYDVAFESCEVPGAR